MIEVKKTTKTMYLGGNIRLIRKKWRYRQEEFGKKFDVQGQSISTYEKGSSEPRIGFLIRLSELSGIGVNDLCLRPLRESEIPEKPFYAPQVSAPFVDEERSNYESLRPEDLADPLYNAHILVAEVKKLKAKVEELEKRLDKER